MIQTILYGNRFFPLYAYVILGGIDETDGAFDLLSLCTLLRSASRARRLTCFLAPHAGSGAVYSFDPVGSYEREFCRAAGAAQSLIQPFLDNQVRSRCRPPATRRAVSAPDALSLPPTRLRRPQIYFKNMTFPEGVPKPTPGQLPLEKVLSLVMDTFTSATERHIEVGDGLEMYVTLSNPSAPEPVDGKLVKQTDDEWADALAGFAGLEARGVDVQWLESLGSVGGRETRCCVLRRELKKD